MHVETYPTFLILRDKEPSLSSSEFGWIERKRKWKWKRRKNTEQGSVYSIYLYIYLSIYIIGLHNSILHDFLYLLKWMQGNIYRDVFPTFLTKKSYGWWITRRRMEIYTQKSEEKYLKESVQKYREALRTISQEKMVSARFRRHSRRAAKSLRSNKLSS